MSDQRSLHPSVQKFKTFVKDHPLLIKEVRQKRTTWQQLYEEWMLLGDDDPQWEKYKKRHLKQDRSESENVESSDQATENSESITQLMSLLKKVNFNDIQHHLSQFNGLISNVQTIMKQFQGSSSNQQSESQQGQQPFSFRKD
ncbi:YlbD family protein [Desertibacillus haloalkaliphilus]|uniref:YlbD family protein n=1 Tax=Desertibacillus haloalkaliphilus TaxID=1328930 RepID=UPI001C2556A2|nr:YlbD family protein [Desertibacillus haloalkaliphilus]MBU8907143.1 YlbD family protein [Desertibacillus haloalkaliphilus]